MHMGIMWEERHRAKPSKLTLFENCYPLVKMGWTRPMCYAYNREALGIQTKAVPTIGMIEAKAVSIALRTGLGAPLRR